MMKQHTITTTLSLLLMGFASWAGFTGCSREAFDERLIPDESGTVSPAENILSPETGIVEGVVRVRLSQDLADALYNEDETTLRASLRAATDGDFDAYLDKINAKRMTRIFPNTGKFEERKRREGLHLWYDIYFDAESSGTVQVAQELPKFASVDFAETVVKVDAPNERVIPFTPDEATTRSASSLPFSDPLLSYQWHYENRAGWLRHEAGADINLFEAWKVETGKPNVVVAVVDGGIDMNHEDLKDHIFWEAPGYNFANGSPKIIPIEHATHVAGTVAACNNNGIGVGGVAGGDGTKDSGVRLMSCQVFSVDTVMDFSKFPPKEKIVQTVAPNFGEALVWAADHGAHIAQNSWGVTYPGVGHIDEAVKVGIDYFIKYAGCDENGNQLPGSPMKGGVVIFAAGNDGLDYECFPGAYEAVVAVASSSPDYTIASYSNRGDWVDITAPGGNIFYERGGVLSTLPGNQYGYMQGTSMACPHVSGIAALILSKFGGEGFTAQQLRDRLENAVKSDDINSLNSEYAGRLGNGYIDACAALRPSSGKAPQAPKEVKVDSQLTSLHLSFKAVADADNGSAVKYLLYVDEAPLSDQRIAKEKVARGEVKDVVVLRSHYAKPGDNLELSITGLDHSTKYYLALVAVDKFGQESAPLFAEAVTLALQNIKITLDKEMPIKLVAGEGVSFKALVDDEGGKRSWSFEVKGDLYGVDYERTSDGVAFRIKGAPVGSHQITLRVTDEYYYQSSEMVIPYEVRANNAPVLKVKAETLYLPSSGKYSTREIPLSDLFQDADGDPLTYKAVVPDPTLFSADIQGDKLVIKSSGVSEGNSYVRLTVTDPYGEKATLTIPVKFVPDEPVYLVYPVPVSKELNLIVSPDPDSLDIRITSPNGVEYIKQRMVLEGSDARHLRIDVSALPTGTYLLKAEGNHGEKYETSFVKL